ncbi:thioredoxin reductase [Heterostelium album PN500]|uniref:Thioredoxin reductase n=1 Tax=Heterostelium pallidum (strain ATCC 26659 / Pp 5 / PN500) TaxID=670386 RepID=D3BQ30_HETP5|nr:thioredoxin reductase [Heterostelium album PN500]EFA76581.1 thioredoxin reductase [Heterostelium album PN500]|eukprot:XP_020428713.1 thioredoxin reductase [Heterostelium album PN500]
MFRLSTKLTSNKTLFSKTVKSVTTLNNITYNTTINNTSRAFSSKLFSSITQSSSTSKKLFGLISSTTLLLQVSNQNKDTLSLTEQSQQQRKMSSYSPSKIENVVIIGSGPAGHTAAVYTGRINIDLITILSYRRRRRRRRRRHYYRARLDPLMFEGFMAGGVAAGGQLTTTTEIENFPGFPGEISGPELMDRMREQSIKCGARIETKNIVKLDLSERPFKIYIEDEPEPIQSKSIILATGATAKKMGVPGEETYWSKGISACAVCDGALPIYRNKHLAVVGGGDTACEEATFLTHFASKVTMLVRRDEMRASKAMQQRVLTNPKIEIIWNHTLLSAQGGDKLTDLTIQNVLTKEEKKLEVGGLFYAIGHVPNTAFLNGQIETDETGYIITKGHSTETNVKGVFACGDVQDKIYRQAITAAGTGCMSALEAERFLSH